MCECDDESTFENSLMLCGGGLPALLREAYSVTPECQRCGSRKMPHGRSLPFPRGYEGDCDCEGYNEPPRPLNLFQGEQFAVRRFVERIILEATARD